MTNEEYIKIKEEQAQLVACRGDLEYALDLAKKAILRLVEDSSNTVNRLGRMREGIMNDDHSGNSRRFMIGMDLDWAWRVEATAHRVRKELEKLIP